MTSQNDRQDFSLKKKNTPVNFILSRQNNNKMSCGVTQRCSWSYSTLCFAVISNLLFVRKLKDS